MLRRILEDMITNATDDEILSATIFPSLLKDLGGDPGKKDRAENDREKNCDHTV